MVGESFNRIIRQSRTGKTIHAVPQLVNALLLKIPRFGVGEKETGRDIIPP